MGWSRDVAAVVAELATRCNPGDVSAECRCSYGDEHITVAAVTARAADFRESCDGIVLDTLTGSTVAAVRKCPSVAAAAVAVALSRATKCCLPRHCAA